MKRVLIAASAVIASCLVAAPAGAADADYCANHDVIYPVISTTTMTPTTATIGRANKTVTVTVKASDDCAIGRITATLAPKNFGTAYVIYLTDFTRIGGSNSNGTWRASKTIEDQQLGGVWQIFKLEVVDTHFNNALKWRMASPTMHLRHETSTLLRKPATKVKKTVTINGRLRAYGAFGTWKVQVQKRAPGKRWSKVRNVTTNKWGDFTTKVTIKGTTYFRVVHFQDNTTTGSVSKTYKVKKKK